MASQDHVTSADGTARLAVHLFHETTGDEGICGIKRLDRGIRKKSRAAPGQSRRLHPARHVPLVRQPRTAVTVMAVPDTPDEESHDRPAKPGARR